MADTDKQKNVDLSEIEAYVNESIERTLQRINNSVKSIGQFRVNESLETIDRTASGNKLSFDNVNKENKNDYPEPKIINIHGFSIARIPIPEGTNHKDIDLSLKGNELHIHWNAHNHQQKVFIPGNFIKEKVKALIDEDVLEVRFPLDNNIRSRKLNIQS